MKTINKYIILLLVVNLLILVSCNVESDIADEANPNSYPVLTITPNQPGANGSSVNEGLAPTYTFTASLSAMLDHAVTISARQVGGDANADDFAFSSVNIAPYTTEAVFSVTIFADGVVEDTESLDLEIGAFTVSNMYTVNPQSDVTPFSITIENCASCVTCDWTLDMQDAYGDGWNGAKLTFDADGTMNDYTLEDGSSGQLMIPVADQANLQITYTAGAWESEVTYQLYDPNGTLILDEGTYPTTGVVYTGVNVCP